jgi:hypothetical protein
MTTIAEALPARETLHGVRQILRFNWPFYVAAVPISIAAPYGIGAIPLPPAVRVVLYSATALVWLWLFGSIVASWFVYDRSELMTGSWIVGALSGAPDTWISVHAGLDEMTPRLERLLGGRGRTFDIFDPSEMTEPSISRARTASSSPAAESVDFRRLPIADASVDAALLLLSAHELRTHESRVALFTEIHRSLSTGGSTIVAEHLRDIPNVVAYGPGALHFHSRGAWLRTFAASGLDVACEGAITPFVRVFVLRRSS